MSLNDVEVYLEGKHCSHNGYTKYAEVSVMITVVLDLAYTIVYSSS